MQKGLLSTLVKKEENSYGGSVNLHLRVQGEHLQVEDHHKLKKLQQLSAVKQDLLVVKNLIHLMQAGAGVGAETSIRITKAAFPNAPPPTAYRRGTPWLKRSGESAESSAAQKKPKNAGFGCYINPTTGRTVVNPGSSSERVVSHGRVMKDTSAVNIDLGFKLSGLKFKGKNVVTTRQLQQQARNRRNNPSTKPTPSAAGSCFTAGPAHAAP
ncbi:hypothetical protein K7X08_027795 [Anisodus acutangulus]|uniref:Uncharacterized protein n=1 Tax=Anisodus acutangulus TaxID=402998 RepID=A0A9Q1LMV4_9SOLA|nr:hypothetical protein K7X08_027795 [Anisodus acutangulus]